uniref:Uncharacterized protein n=1 Tax=Kalanchoe fedtschenkoi TaxID=63787 RepID=A0A7N0V7B2_KALFE
MSVVSVASKAGNYLQDNEPAPSSIRRAECWFYFGGLRFWFYFPFVTACKTIHLCSFAVCLWHLSDQILSASTPIHLCSFAVSIQKPKSQS